MALRSHIPGPGPYWATTAVVALPLAFGGFVLIRRHGPSRTDGFAPPAELRRSASVSAARRRARVLRPSLAGRRPAAKDVGYPLGRARGGGVALWPSWEASLRVVAEPGSGKTRTVLAPILAQHPGAVLATSTKADLYELTAGARRSEGRPVAIFDPQGLLPDGPALLWSPILGCRDPEVALRRADALLSGNPGRDDEARQGGIFTHSARELLGCYLRAADLDGRDLRSVLAWASRLSDPAPADILRQRAPEDDWAAKGVTHTTGAPETTSGVARYLTQALACFAHGGVVATCCPARGRNFNIEAHLRAQGSVYLFGSGAGLGPVAPLVTALAEEVVVVAEALARRRPNGRLDPPLLLLLDEVANVAPLPSLPGLLATARAKGIVIVYALQSFSQAVTRWGPSQAETMANATTITEVFGGLSLARDLEDLERLCGRRRVRRESIHLGAAPGHSTATRHWDYEPVMRADEIRTLRSGSTLVLWSNFAPIIAQHRRVPRRLARQWAADPEPTWWQKIVRR